MNRDSMTCLCCQGKGIIQEIKHGSIHNRQCPCCNGTGTVDAAEPAPFPPAPKPEPILCPDCGGVGYIQTVATYGSAEFCERCQGSGHLKLPEIKPLKLVEPEHTPLCPACNGTGDQPRSDFPCGVCKGTGIQQNPDPLED